jgi:hypothetical protein
MDFSIFRLSMSELHCAISQKKKVRKRAIRQIEKMGHEFGAYECILSREKKMCGVGLGHHIILHLEEKTF